MEKYLIYSKNFDLVKRFGKERFDILAYKEYKTLEFVHVSRAWDVSTPDHVDNGVAIEMIVDNCVLIRMGLNHNSFIYRDKQISLFSDLDEDNLFAETIYHINRYSRCGDISICRKIVDEWKSREKILRYGEAHRFLTLNC